MHFLLVKVIGCKVIPLVRSIFIGQNRGLYNRMHCTNALHSPSRQVREKISSSFLDAKVTESNPNHELISK